jgi:segregation and condensation protein A
MTENVRYRVRLPDFEGPLDLLLQVIERNELPITAITLANIANEYLNYIEQLTEINPAEIAEFLVVAAKLLLIKSQALLPGTPKGLNTTEEATVTAEELVAQLQEYKKIKNAALLLRQRQESGLESFVSKRRGANEGILRQVTADLEKSGGNLGGTGLQGVTLENLLALVRRRLAQQRQEQLKLPLMTTPQNISNLTRKVKIEDKIALVENRLQTQTSLHFSDLFDNPQANHQEIVVTFMALLELLRFRKINIIQAEHFGEIVIERI